MAYYLAGIPKTVDEQILRDHFLERLRNCACTEHALRNYDAADRDDGVRSYTYFMVQASRQIALRRQRENEEASPAAPANLSQHCTQWAKKGKCKHGAKCNNMHGANRRGSAAVSSSTVALAASPAAPVHTDTKGQGKGKDNNGNPNAKGNGEGKGAYSPPRSESASTRSCFEFSKGKCSKADKCPFTHRKLILLKKMSSVMDGHVPRRLMLRVGETTPPALPPRTQTLLSLLMSEETARKGRSVIFTTLKPEIVSRCPLHLPRRRPRWLAKPLLVLHLPSLLVPVL